MELAYFGIHSYDKNVCFIQREKLLLLDMLLKFSFIYLSFLSHKLRFKYDRRCIIKFSFMYENTSKLKTNIGEHDFSILFNI